MWLAQHVLRTVAHDLIPAAISGSGVCCKRPARKSQLHLTILRCVQAEEEEARKDAEELAANPVKRMRKAASSGASLEDVLAELNGIEVEGGQIGRSRVLYEVS